MKIIPDSVATRMKSALGNLWQVGHPALPLEEPQKEEASPPAVQVAPRLEEKKGPFVPRIFSLSVEFPNSDSQWQGSDLPVQQTLRKTEEWLGSIQGTETEIRIPSRYLEDLGYLLMEARPEAQLQILKALGDIYSHEPLLHIASKKNFEKIVVPAISAVIAQPEAALSVRLASIAMLGQLAPRSKAAIDPLLRELRNPHPEIRVACLAALGRFQGHWNEPLDASVLKMLEDPSPAVRTEALRTLTKLEISSAQAMSAIMRSLEDPHAEVRLEGLAALSDLFSLYLSADEFVDPEEVERAADLLGAIYPLLHDGETKVQTRAVLVLKDFRVLLDFPPDRIAGMIRAHGRKHPQEGLALHSRWARIQNLSVGILEYLRQEQHSQRADLSVACLHVLDRLGSPYEEEIIRQTAALDAPQTRTILEALAALKSWGLFSSTAHRKVLGLTQHRDPEIRAAALSTLAAIHPQQALPALRRAIGDSDAEARTSAARALGTIPSGKDAALQALIGLSKDPNEQVRAATLASLGNYAFDPAVLSILLEAFTDGESSVRRAAVQASRSWAENLSLEDFESHRLELHIVRLFSDPNAEIRLASLELFFACYDLTPNFPKYQASILRMASEDPDPEIRNLIGAYADFFFNSRGLRRHSLL